MISVIQVQEMNNDENVVENRKVGSYFHIPIDIMNSIRAICISAMKIILFSVLFTIPWTVIPRTNSIIHQSHWWEVMIPMATWFVLTAASQILLFKTWFKEQALISISNHFKMYFMNLIPYSVLYIISYLIWSVYMQFKHPLPRLGLIIIPNYIIWMIGLWFVLPSHLLARDNFRQKLKIFMVYFIWQTVANIQKEVLSTLFKVFPAGWQFFVPFLVAGAREMDKRVKSKLVTKMMGVQDEPAIVLVTIIASTGYSFFIAIRLVGAEFSTICCMLGIDAILHFRITYKIVRGFRKVDVEGIETLSIQTNINISRLIIGELIEGLTPIIYGICMALAYYGPNVFLFANIGNNYWSTEVNDIGPLFTTMSILFAIDTFNVLINSLLVWKFVKVGMLSEFARVLNRHWYPMAVCLATYMVIYFVTTDINFGLDETRSFQWISNEGWINLVNNSNDLSKEEKENLLSVTTLQ